MLFNILLTDNFAIILCIGYPYHNEFNLSQHAKNIPNNLFDDDDDGGDDSREGVYLCMQHAERIHRASHRKTETNRQKHCKTEQ